MEYRRAKEEERFEAVRLEADIFHKEQGMPAEDDLLNRKPIIWIAEEEGKIIGTAAAWIVDGRTRWGRFVIRPEYRGKGIGYALAGYCFNDLFTHGTDAIYMEARDATVHIVCSLGGEITGDPVIFFGQNETPLIIRKENFKINW